MSKIEKINFSYPRNSIQSVFDTDTMSALELAAATSEKVDECVELVNGVEQSAIEATSIVENMRIQQDNFILENDDIRAQLLVDNQKLLADLTESNNDFIETVNESKESFETNMTNALTNFQGEVATLKDNFISEVNTSKSTFETNMTNAIENIVETSTETVNNAVNNKIDILINDGTIKNILDSNILQDIKTNINDLSTNFAEETIKINNKINTLINIKEYGAIGDGLVDDTISIKNAISNIKGGETLFFPKGIYKISDEIIVNKSINIDFGNSIIRTSNPIGMTFSGTLKSSHTVTSDYVKDVSNNKLTLNNTTGINIGDIINVTSTDLFDTSRSYYFKGGNAIVTNIIDNNVYFNINFPFNMTSSSITVKIYSPIKINIKNIHLIEGINSLENNSKGINILYATNSHISNISTNNFPININIQYCVNIKCELIETRNSKTSNAQNFDGYGIMVASSTNVALNNLMLNSGQHGLSTGGWEPCYNISLINSILKSQYGRTGFDTHENIIGMYVKNCICFGLACGGMDIIFENCNFLNDENNPQSQNALSVGESETPYNYKFINCNFNNQLIQLIDYYQIASSTRKYVKDIIFTDCKNIALRLAVTETSTIDKIAEIENVTFNRCDEVSLVTSDKVKNINFNNCIKKLNNTFFNQIAKNSIYQIVENINIINCIIPHSYNKLSCNLVKNLIIDNLKMEIDFDNSQLNFENIENVIINNSNFIKNGLNIRGINVGTKISEMFIANSILNFNNNMLTNVAKIIKPHFINSVINNETCNIITTTSGVKIKTIISDSGVFTPTIL